MADPPFTDGQSRHEATPEAPSPRTVPARYYSEASRRPRVAFGELHSRIAVTAAPRDPEPIGTATEGGWVMTGGGFPEAAWQLVVRGVILEGRYALRGGAFDELTEGC